MIGPWLKNFDETTRKDRVYQLGLLTGLRGEKDGTFRPANFERGLVLDRLVELHKPRRVLEIGTGRGLGAFALAAAARAYGSEIEITTADLIPLNTTQDYALELDGKPQRIRASCEEIWSKHLDSELRSRITPLTGSTTKTLPKLAASGRKFDLIFIDAGHDLFSVAHDLAYSAELLAPGGAILMDDFAPLEDFGLGTCIVLTHARRLFRQVELFPTEGLVYGGAVFPEAPRGMVYLSDARSSEYRVRRGLLPFWKVAGLLLDQCYRPAAFPVATS
jgi:predicted O-methyltransferase YrrM